MNQPTPRNFQQEFKDNVNALGIPSDLFQHTPIDTVILSEAIEKFLLNIPITNDQFTLDAHQRILNKDFNLETISKMLNFLVGQSAKGLTMDHKQFVDFQTDLRKVIQNYNVIVAPVKTEIEREAKKYEVQQNPPGALKGHAKKG